ncbi:MAG: hypothetical protein B7Z02_10440 [Rhodobacterales bacterium 32-67-9]|nr:MAG: hypothetical protein B7Z02_10440 [Rhodobacterales bacterium 32-67-9]
MIELLFVVCLGAAPATCEERSLLFQDISPMTCLVGAQPALAEWVAGHPKWTISRWSCRTLRTGERDI